MHAANDFDSLQHIPNVCSSLRLILLPPPHPKSALADPPQRKPYARQTVCHNAQSAALLSSSGLVMYFSTLPAPSSSAPCILTILTHLRVCVKICILTHPRNSLAQTVAHKCVSRLHPPRFPSMSKVAALHVVEQKLHVVGSVCNREKCLAGDRGNFTPQPPLRSP